MRFEPLNGHLAGAASALAITIPHTLGLGLIAFAPIAAEVPASALALWSAALSGGLMALLIRSKGVIHAPSSVVALIFGQMLALVMRTGAADNITIGQGLAITGVFVSLSFTLQWLIGLTGLAGFSRFLPISVIHGFSAGVGISLVGSQLLSPLGNGAWLWETNLFWDISAAAAVVLLSLLLQKRWPHFPSLLLSLGVVAVLAMAFAPEGNLTLLASSPTLQLPPSPDWLHAPWQAVIDRVGIQLLSLALLMGVVNALDILVWHQELETKHGVRSSPDKVLMQGSRISLLVALLGMLPSSASPSRSRTALQHTAEPTILIDRWHAGAMLVIALTGHLWLHWLPAYCLAGALTVAGAKMIPPSMLRLKTDRSSRTTYWQSWLVAICFAVMGGAMALVAGLIVATTGLLRASGRHAIRRMHLEGKLRSRHIRRKDEDDWLAERMSQVAVFELQGIVSFGVAALIVDQVRHHLGQHRFVVLDVSRVPAWDDTGYARLLALGREFQLLGVILVISGMRGQDPTALEGLRMFSDMDYALEWVEDQLLQDFPSNLKAEAVPSPLGELGEGLPAAACAALIEKMQARRYTAGELIFRSGDTGRAIMLVQCGSVTLSTSSDPRKRLRLSVIGPSMFFGEVAFLNGIKRTAFAHAGTADTIVWSLDWATYQAWAREHPDLALSFMNQLTQSFIRRFISTSNQLRAALA